MKYTKERLLLLLLFILIPSFFVNAEQIEISSFYGKYDVSQKAQGQHSLSLRGPKIEKWDTGQSVAKKPYTIGVLTPNIQDSYWSAVNYGILQQAQESNVSIILYDAHGYANLDTQQQQLNKLRNSNIDGIILGSISYTANNDIVNSIVDSGIPVIELVNDISAKNITAKSMVSFYDMGFLAGEYIVNEVDALAKAVSVAFLPGPDGSGWASASLMGFQAATEFTAHKIDIVDISWGDTTSESQVALLQKVLTHYPNIDYIVGNAVAAVAATKLLPKRGSKAKVISTYITPDVYDAILKQNIAAAPSDMAADQARISVGMMVQALNGQKAGIDFPFRAGPMIPVITSKNINEYPFDELFGPRNFTPVFRWQAQLNR